MERISGQKITGLWFDNYGGAMHVEVGEKEYRMTAVELVKMVNEFTFELEKKRVHTYLINPKRIG